MKTTWAPAERSTVEASLLCWQRKNAVDGNFQRLPPHRNQYDPIGQLGFQALLVRLFADLPMAPAPPTPADVNRELTICLKANLLVPVHLV